MFPTDPPIVPGLQAFRSVHRRNKSPLEPSFEAPPIDCNSINCKTLFGSLTEFHSYQFDQGEIKPLQTFQDTLNYLSSICNEDGYLYPPQEVFVQIDGATGEFNGIEKPRSWKAADQFSLPPTHRLILKGEGPDADFRLGIGTFILGLLSALYGTRLQFHGWQVDTKIKVKRSNSNIYFFQNDVERFMSTSINSWNNWTNQVKLEMSNILALYGKIDTYSETWENFTAAYLVCDGCFSVLHRLFRVNINHKAKFKLACEKFGIPFEKDAVDEIYRLRTDLFHYIKWNKGLFGFETGDAIWRVSDLRNLCLRLIIGLCGYKSDFLKTSWTSTFGGRL